MTADLLIPRFKLIADYPGNSREVGGITTENYTASYFRKYPANFKELFWWEEREESELPEYLFYADENSSLKGIHKVHSWLSRNRGFVNIYGIGDCVISRGWRIATGEEINSLTLSPNKEQMSKP